MKKIPLDVLQEKARLLTVNEFKNYIFPYDLYNKMTLGVVMDNDYERVFVLYIPRERPKDAIDISRTRMNIYTGEGFVEYVGLEHKKDS